MAPTELIPRARAAYELGRARLGLQRAVCVLPLAFCALVPCQKPVFVAVALGALFVAVALFSYLGKAAGSAVLPGVLAGLPALALPIGVRLTGHLCELPGCIALCLPACAVGGIVSGAALALAANLEEAQPRRREFLLAALVLASLTGSIGCAAAGMTGVMAMLAGTAIVSAPALLAAAR